MKLKNIVRLVLGIAILAILVYNVGFTGVIDAITSLNPIYLPAIAAYYVVFFVLATAGFKLLTAPLANIPFKKLFKHYCMSWAVGLVMPGRIGDFSIIYFLGKEGIKTGQATSIALLEKVLTMIVLAAIAVIGFFTFLTLTQAIWLVVILVLGFSLFVAMLFTGLGRVLVRKILGKHQKKFAGFSTTLNYFLKKQKKRLLLALIFAFLRWIASSLTIYIIILALGQHVDFVSVILVHATVIMVSMIPLTMAGLGIRESAAVFLFGKIGVLATVVTGIYLIFAGINYTLAAIIGLLYLRKK
ncbi:MAG: flippase-like domain-containing protein [bacterium]|nr:flippase-like domain-containing protein [bacterium]